MNRYERHLTKDHARPDTVLEIVSRVRQRKDYLMSRLAYETGSGRSRLRNKYRSPAFLSGPVDHLPGAAD